MEIQTLSEELSINPSLDVSILALFYIDEHHNTYIFTQNRPNNQGLGGHLEFPGGKIEQNETPIDAAVREIKEEQDFEIAQDQLRLFGIFNHNYEHFKVVLHVYWAILTLEQRHLLPSSGLRPFSSGNDLALLKAQMLKANEMILERLFLLKEDQENQ